MHSDDIIVVDNGSSKPSAFPQQTVKRLGVTHKVSLSEIYKRHGLLNNEHKIKEINT